jgi:hypothetical protein
MLCKQFVYKIENLESNPLRRERQFYAGQAGLGNVDQKCRRRLPFRSFYLPTMASLLVLQHRMPWKNPNVVDVL